MLAHRTLCNNALLQALLLLMMTATILGLDAHITVTMHLAQQHLDISTKLLVPKAVVIHQE